ncbi:MAG: DUF2029 domain-containing protein [Planctomycetes bacterium]|nr:DUF2029 domain-containing protein [Planctomycetota bacterium]
MATPHRALVLSTLALTTLLSAAFVILIPIGKGADEDEHLDYALHLATEHRLPDPRAEAVGQQQHPPLPYLAMATLFSLTRDSFDTLDEDAGRDWFGRRTLFRPGHKKGTEIEGAAPRTLARARTPEGSFYLLRGLSLIAGLVAATFLLLALRELLPQRPGLAVATWAAVISLPVVTFHFAMNGNDPWIAALGTILGWYVLRARRRGELLAWRPTIVMGVLLGLAFLTKLHALGIAVFAALCILAEAGPLGRRLRALAILVAGPLLLAGWWHYRQYQLQGGLLSLEHHAQYRPWLLRLGDRPSWLYWDAAVSALESFFGSMGQDQIQPLRPFALLPGGLAVLAGLAWFLSRPRGKRKEADESGTPRLPVAAACGATLILLVAILIANRHYYHLHARYFLSLLVPLSLLLVVGLERLLQDRTVFVLTTATLWNLAFTVATILIFVVPRYSVPTGKFERGRVATYYDCGHEGFDDAKAGAEVLTRHFPDHFRPEDTVRFEVPRGGEPELVYRLTIPDPSRPWQLRVRYPDPLPRHGGDLPAPTGVALLVDKWTLHGPVSMWSARGDYRYPLPMPVTQDGAIEVWWQSHVPTPAGVACAELWLEEAWLQIREPVVTNAVRGELAIMVENVDSEASHEALVVVQRGAEEVARTSAPLRLAPGEVFPLRLACEGTLENLSAHVIDLGAGPLADLKLAYWAADPAFVAGRIEVPDIEVLRVDDTPMESDRLAKVALHRMLPGRYRLLVVHRRDADPFVDGAVIIQAEAARLTMTGSREDAGYGEDLIARVFEVVIDGPGETRVDLTLFAGPKAAREGRMFHLDRLILERSRAASAFTRGILTTDR